MSESKDQSLMHEQQHLVLHQQFNEAIYMADDIITKNYLSRLVEMDVVDPDPSMFIAEKKDAVRLVRIDEMVYSKDEYATHKFASVFGAMTTVENAVFLLIDSDGEKAKFYMGVRCDDHRREADMQLTTLRNSLQGQFPGIKMTDNSEYTNPDIVELMKGIDPGAVSSVSCVANLRDEDTRDNKAFLQGLEKFALSLQGKPYTAFILANSLPQDRVAEVRHMYEKIYTQLSPFAEQQLAYGTNESWNSSTTDSEGTSEGKSYSFGYSKNWGTTISENTGESVSVSKENTASRVLGALGAVAGIAATAIGAVTTVASGGAATPITAPLIAAGGIAAAGGMGAALVKKTTTTASNTNRGVAQNEGEAENENLGMNVGQNKNHAETVGESSGTTHSLTLTTKNKTILSLLERIDNQLERMREFESYGMWECSAFFISSEPNISEIAAATYKAIMSGEHTGVEISTVNSWRHDSDKTEKIYKYITNFMQPLFSYQSGQDALAVTAGTFVSGKELALHMGLPRRSVPGFPVIEHAEFAMEPIRYDTKQGGPSFPLGRVYSMGKETETAAHLDVNGLTMHTFVTGSTGSGKSNTVYEMLHQLRSKYKIPFLVIEPAKGEYKRVFGQYDDVKVYGTNPKKTDLLRINPFRFPADVHVLEHLDRLVELFNVCWPMYAAMPAILKEAMQRAYTAVGWDIEASINSKGERFPNFTELLFQIENVINESKYSSDSKGDYSGALITRVRSLTNGLNGLIFTNNDLTDSELFGVGAEAKSIIVDLSRVGSTETKSLIMGLLVIKLNEYRMTSCEINSDLSHVTVLEEAHNLLKRTSIEQSSESSNLLGKSVELLANSIAEMRTYGEGFIIVDQSPGLLDMSVIRNTNTKIILRLPEQSDRELVGRSASLNDEQISELSKLAQGVAAIYQNDWVEPVLVKVTKCKIIEKEFEHTPDRSYSCEKAVMKQIVHFLVQGRVSEKLDFNTSEIRKALGSLKLTSRQQDFVERHIDEYELKGHTTIWRADKFDALARFVSQASELSSQVDDIVAEAADNDEVTERIFATIKRQSPELSEIVMSALTHCLMKGFALKQTNDGNREVLYKQWVEAMTERGDVK